jgi:hypothetical protein
MTLRLESNNIYAYNLYNMFGANKYAISIEDGTRGSWNDGDRTRGSWNDGERTRGSWNDSERTRGSWNDSERTRGSWNDGERTLGSWNDSERTKSLQETYDYGVFAKRREFKRFTKNGHVYYAVPHNKTYTVRMINNTDGRVNCVLKIDGVTMGKWRVDAYSDILIGRPSHNQRKFTFVKETSWQGKMGGVESENSRNGLVEVIFIPEIKTERVFDTFYENNAVPFTSNNQESRNLFLDGPDSNFNQIFYNNATSGKNQYAYAAGGTVLGDDSLQTFGSASHIIEDPSKRVIKRVRLVVQEDRNPYVSLRTNTRYDQSYDDPIPPQIGHGTANVWGWMDEFGLNNNNNYNFEGFSK